MKVREQRGGLAESMETVKEIEPTMAALKQWADESFGDFLPPDLSGMEIKKYGKGIDTRIGWNTHIVHVPGWGVLGFTDGPLQETD